MTEYNFIAIIKESEIGKGGAFIEFPFDVEKEFGVKGRVPVIAYFENIEYAGSLVKMGASCHIIGILKSIREKLNKEIGDFVNARIYKDESERKVEVHQDLEAELSKNEELKIKYYKLSFTNQKEINNLLNSAKTDATKSKRLNKIITDLLK